MKLNWDVGLGIGIVSALAFSIIFKVDTKTKWPPRAGAS